MRKDSNLVQYIIFCNCLTGLETLNQVSLVSRGRQALEVKTG